MLEVGSKKKTHQQFHSLAANDLALNKCAMAADPGTSGWIHIKAMDDQPAFFAHTQAQTQAWLEECSTLPLPELRQ